MNSLERTFLFKQFLLRCTLVQISKVNISWTFYKEIFVCMFLLSLLYFHCDYNKYFDYLNCELTTRSLSIFLNWCIMYIIYIFRTIVLIFVTMFITKFWSLYLSFLCKFSTNMCKFRSTSNFIQILSKEKCANLSVFTLKE